MAEGNVISLAGMEPGAHVLEITTGTGDGAPPVTRVDIAVRRPVMWSAVFWLLVSRSSLYKKLTALTGQSPLEFIRKIRLRRGRELLAGRGLTIAEVAYSVGLSPKQFSKFFKEEYGVLPSRINGDGTEK